MIFVGLKDYKTGYKAGVTKQNQLITAPLSYSTPIAKTINTVDTAFNFIKAKSSFRIVITSIFLYGDKNIGVNDATVELYEALENDTTTVSKSILSLEIPKNSDVILTGLNWVTSTGVFLNGKTNDANIFAVVGAYYIPDEINTNLLIS